MKVTDYLPELFYLVDSELEAMNLTRLRRRGPRPTLYDSEVITIELAGEFFGIDTAENNVRECFALVAEISAAVLAKMQMTVEPIVGREIGRHIPSSTAKVGDEHPPAKRAACNCGHTGRQDMLLIAMNDVRAAQMREH